MSRVDVLLVGCSSDLKIQIIEALANLIPNENLRILNCAVSVGREVLKDIKAPVHFEYDGSDPGWRAKIEKGYRLEDIRYK